MRTRVFFPLIAHTITCVVLGSIFLFCGASQVVSIGKFGPVAPFHTTNRYFSFIARDPAGSEHLLRALRELPDKDPVAVVFREANDSDTLLAYLVTYFAWPRPVTSLPTEHNDLRSQATAVRADHVSAVFFCGVTPPSNLQFTWITPGLAMAKRPSSRTQ